MNVHRGISLREGLAYARELGVEVRYASGTGEVLFVYGRRCVRHNMRRKDASRALQTLLKRALRGGIR